MALTVGGTPVKAVYVGSTPVKAVYVGSEKIWPTRETVQITLGAGLEARDQIWAALSARGLNYQTVTEIPFDIELVGSGSAQNMFSSCSALTSVPDMDTSQVTSMANMFSGCSSLTSVPAMNTGQVTNMRNMFNGCSSLTSVPAMNTGQVTNMRYMFHGCSALTSVPDMATSNVTDMERMFRYCSALTDGNVRLIGRHPDVDTTDMITGSGLTREPWYKADGTPDDGPTIEVHEVSLTDVRGSGTVHPLLTVTVPAGETWDVRIQGTMTKASGISSSQPYVLIGDASFGPYGLGEAVDCSGTVTSADSTIAIRTSSNTAYASFSGTVTIEK